MYHKKIDFHAHFISDTYRAYLEQYVGANPDGFPTPSWSVKEQLSEMDKLGIAFAFLSVSSPNLSAAGREDEVKMVHKINVEGKKIVNQCPDRLGLFASLPLPHVEESIREAKFALDKLHADGFGLSTHYAGVYLSDSSYDPLFAFLNKRKAVIAVHPTQPSALPANVNEELPIPAMEFFMDTTRTFTAMVLNNVFERFPEIKWIFPHAGAFIPLLADRIAGFSMQFRSNMKHPYPVDFKGDMRHVYFDLAGFSAKKQLHDLLIDVSYKNLLYGSDTPYTPVIGCIAQTGALEDTKELTKEQKMAVFTGNAVALVPRLGNILGVEGTGNSVSYGDRKLTLGEKRSRAVRKVISQFYGAVFNK